MIYGVLNLVFQQAALGALLSLSGPLFFALNYLLVYQPVAVLEAFAADLRHVSNFYLSGIH